MILLGSLTDACGASGQRGWVCEAMYQITGNEDLSKIADAISIPIRLVLVVVIAVIVAWITRRIIARSLRRVRDSDRGSAFRQQGDIPVPTNLENERRIGRFATLTVSLQNVATIAIWILASFVFIDQLGYNVGSVFVAVSAISIIIGIGAQQVIKDFFGGLFILMEDQFGVGDVIEVGEASGKVESMSLRVTRIRDVEGVVWWIPNGSITEVGNRSKEWSRALLDVEFLPVVDPGAAISLLEDVGAKIMSEKNWAERLLDQPEVWGVQELSEVSMKIRLVVKTVPLEQWAVARELRARIVVACRGAVLPLVGQPLSPGSGSAVTTNPSVHSDRPSAPEGEADGR